MTGLVGKSFRDFVWVFCPIPTAHIVHVESKIQWFCILSYIVYSVHIVAECGLINTVNRMGYSMAMGYSMDVQDDTQANKMFPTASC